MLQCAKQESQRSSTEAEIETEWSDWHPKKACSSIRTTLEQHSNVKADNDLHGVRPREFMSWKRSR
jgi:hypothetical protein